MCTGVTRTGLADDPRAHFQDHQAPTRVFLTRGEAQNQRMGAVGGLRARPGDVVAVGRGPAGSGTHEAVRDPEVVVRCACSPVASAEGQGVVRSGGSDEGVVDGAAPDPGARE